MPHLEKFRNLLKRLKKETGAEPLVYLSDYKDGERITIRMTWYQGKEEHALECSFGEKDWNAFLLPEKKLIEDFIWLIKIKMRPS